MDFAAVPSKFALIARDIKLSHSVFALPFALLATFLAAEGKPRWDHLALIIVCMVFARTFAMLTNRYVDREIDRSNPRTAGRALPAGHLRPRDVLGGIVLSGAGLVAGASMFGVLDGNWWPLILAPVVLMWLGAYGLMKRWTVLCHFFLGAALAISPLAAALAIRPEALEALTLWWLSGFVLLWVAGFDVIYALQDEPIDRRDGLHSIPAKVGRINALLISKAIHIGALVALIMTERSSAELSVLFKGGIAIVAVLLIVEHYAASRDRFTMAFFTINGLISLLLGGLGIAEILM